MRLQTYLKVGGAILLTGFLAACGSDNNNAVTPTPPAAAASFESQFGSEFATIFDASPTSVPATPDANAVPALQPAGTPIAFPASGA